ncbi:hypothetical protein ACWIGW_36370 [Nocardia brasiliensis]
MQVTSEPGKFNLAAKTVGVAGLSLAMTAAAVLFAPSAAAIDVTTTVAVTSGSHGGRVGTGCKATLTSTTTPAPTTGWSAFFYDNDVFIGTGPATGPGGQRNITWTPTTTGTHVLRADVILGRPYPPSSGSITVAVTTGLDLGTICIPLPF